MFKNPEYNAVKIVILVALVALGGWFVYGKVNSGNAGLVISRAPGCDKSTAPYVNITYPKGGETFTAGQKVTIKWVYCNLNGAQTVWPMLTTPSGNAVSDLTNTTGPTPLQNGQVVFTIPKDAIDMTAYFGKQNFKFGLHTSNVPWPYTNLFTVVADNTNSPK